MDIVSFDNVAIVQFRTKDGQFVYGWTEAIHDFDTIDFIPTVFKLKGEIINKVVYFSPEEVLDPKDPSYNIDNPNIAHYLIRLGSVGIAKSILDDPSYLNQYITDIHWLTMEIGGNENMMIGTEDVYRQKPYCPNCFFAPKQEENGSLKCNYCGLNYEVLDISTELGGPKYKINIISNNEEEVDENLTPVAMMEPSSKETDHEGRDEPSDEPDGREKGNDQGEISSDDSTDGDSTEELTSSISYYPPEGSEDDGEDQRSEQLHGEDDPSPSSDTERSVDDDRRGFEHPKEESDDRVKEEDTVEEDNKASESFSMATGPVTVKLDWQSDLILSAINCVLSDIDTEAALISRYRNELMDRVVENDYKITEEMIRRVIDALIAHQYRTESSGVYLAKLINLLKK